MAMGGRSAIQAVLVHIPTVYLLHVPNNLHPEKDVEENAGWLLHVRVNQEGAP